MNFIKTLRYKIFGDNKSTGVASLTTQPIISLKQKQSWENITAQDMEKISPASMRENNADFFLSTLYEQGSEMGLWNIVPDTVSMYGKFDWDGKLTTNALVQFPTDSLGKVLSQYYIYHNGIIYMYDLYDMGLNQVVPITHLTPEQDVIFRRTIEILAKEYKVRPFAYPFNYRCIHEISSEELSKRPYRMLDYFQRDLQRWQESNPLRSPVRCDGCKQGCYMGRQKHYHTYFDGSGDWNEFPTINHIWAKNCRGKCATKIQEYINSIQQNQK